MYTIYQKLLEKQHNALHKAAYMQIVVITYNKAKWYSLELSHIICELVYYSIV